jgi:hypothetical protein
VKRAALVFAMCGVGVATALASSACSSSSDGSHFTDDAGAGDDGSGGDGSGLGDGGGGSDVNFGTDTPTCTKVHCSSDLHAVMCDDKVLKTCPLDQGCANGNCVPACEAAKANKTTIGCDYFTIAPDTGSQYGWQGSCFAAFVANTWGSPVTLGLERDGQTIDVSQSTRIPSGNGQSLTYAPLTNKQILPGQVAIVFLSGTPNATLSPCPAGITPAMVTDPAQHGTGIGKAFHLTASAPVVSYDIYPYGGGNSAITSATLLLPTTAWDTNYIAVDAYKTVPSTWSLPWIAVVAAEDQTTVTISPTSAIVGGTGVAATGQGVPATYTINRGQYVQFVQDAELVGSPVQSNKPVAFFGGNTCMDVPTSIQACDGAHQQIPPVKALGSEYVGVRHRNRYPGMEETPPWRVVGAVDGTQLAWEPSTPAGAPTTLAAGQLAEFSASGPFVVKSQDDKHPFYFAQYMTGCTAYWGSSGDCRGDPEFVNVVAALQYLDHYTFFTDPTYSETHLVIVRSKVNGAFKDVTLDCAMGPLTGWKPVGTSGRFETTGIDLVTGDFQKVAGCDNGRHEMKSDAPFGVTVWGWGSAATTGFKTSAVSYGYPAGMSVMPINTVVVPPTPR